MKSLCLLALLLESFDVASLAQSPAPKTVYLLPMSGGLDQHLAGWLTREHVLQVVTDPALADAVMTDSVDQSFQQTLERIRPTGKESGKDKDDDRTPPLQFRANGARGTVFLVDPKTRQVIWSDFEKAPRSRDSAGLNHLAGKIVKKLHANAPK